MTRRLLLTLTLAATALAPVAAADAASKATYPQVSKVEPMSLGIGDTLKITGKHFRPGKGKNTVVFKRDGRKAVFVKAHAATKTSLSVVVPEKLRSSLGRKNGDEVPTKFRLRILSKRFAKGYTALKSSPTIAPVSKRQAAEEAKKAADAVTALAAPAGSAPASPPPPPDCDNDGTPDAVDANDDADGLTDAFEATLKTDRCNVDTDGDGMEDGWEHKSAFDLNRHSCPNPVPYPSPCQAIAPALYPAKKAYPNPLDSSDAGTDFDGDFISAGLEHQAWQRKVGAVRDFSQPLWYSDGLQASIDDGHSATCRGMIVPPPFSDTNYSGPAYAVYSLDRMGMDTEDGCLNDGERDEDGDFLSNFVELNGPLSSEDQYWTPIYKEPAFKISYEGTDWLDPDTDGDSIVDARDDQDRDDFWNIEETSRAPDLDAVQGTTWNHYLWVEPFNPCLPSIQSRTCPPVVLVGGEPWFPFYKETPVPIEKRYPLYGTTNIYGAPFEWRGIPVGQQTMPPLHPVPRCRVGTPPTCT